MQCSDTAATTATAAASTVGGGRGNAAASLATSPRALAIPRVSDLERATLLRRLGRVLPPLSAAVREFARCAASVNCGDERAANALVSTTEAVQDGLAGMLAAPLVMPPLQSLSGGEGGGEA